MKIVILDGYTLNPGDLDWSPIASLSEPAIYERSAKDELVERAKGAEIVLVNKVVLSRETLDQLPDLRYIGVMATGYNNVDVVAAKERGIIVTNVKAYGPASVAQHTFGLLLALANHLELHSQSVHAGDWVNSKDFCYWNTPLIELTGKTFGLIGLGDIGSKVAKIAKALGMRTIAFRRNPEKTVEDGVEMVSLEELFSQGDVISLHCPLTEDTKEIINKNSLAKMKSTSFLLNTGRGPLINERDLAEALERGIIAGAGLDVLSTEPPTSDNPLLSAPNCIITPHIAWASFEARKRLLQMVASNIEAFLNGKPVNVVS